MGTLTRRTEFLTGYTPPVPSSPTLVAFSTNSTPQTNIASGTPVLVASSFTWASGDVVVVAGSIEAGGSSLLVDNETNLTFTAVSAGAGTGTDAWGRMWYAVATGAGSGTISAASTLSTNQCCCLSAWHYTGSSGIGNTAAAAVTVDTRTITMSASANSAVVTQLADFNALNTAMAGVANTGTLTERVESLSATDYDVFAYDWLDVSSGSGTWGVGATGGTRRFTFAGVVEVLT